jgi:hypothetical protein
MLIFQCYSVILITDFIQMHFSFVLINCILFLSSQNLFRLSLNVPIVRRGDIIWRLSVGDLLQHITFSWNYIKSWTDINILRGAELRDII